MDVESCVNKSLNDWFLCWSGLSSKANQGRAWNSLFFAVSWTIWEARNQIDFRGIMTDIGQAKDTVKFRVVWWFKYLGKGSKVPISTMLLNVKDNCSTQNSVKVHHPTE
ncbi:hypothetical protein Dsin_005583 [Dipteronia sinensis]|uniref:Reverse transcriptase zinc-binding domain-containing protein n=1 Tax=Dipteronia sinensis TaxID=43782 RepID=A0AAE0AWU4_9ROSI|nr:hypothetical protein Dsin_005583 [Dipteronia sinensis]